MTRNTMNSPINSKAQSYQSLYEYFDSLPMLKLRREAYGEDIGQHSWVTVEDLRLDIHRLKLSTTSHILDLGCGPCGPLTYILKSCGCFGTGLDLSGAALAVGQHRAICLGVGDRLTVREANLDDQLDEESCSFDAVISLDVVLHLRDRVRTFCEIGRVLTPGGRFLFTDSGVLHGSISSEDLARRSAHGSTNLCGPEFNEKALKEAGFVLLEIEDRTESLISVATGRLHARTKYQTDFEAIEGANKFARYQQYLNAVIATAETGALRRVMYLSESRALP